MSVKYIIYNIVGLWLPKESQTSNAFIQDILAQKKRVLETRAVKMINFKESWLEFTVKNVWP